jgi:hypothetical protein
VGGRLSRPAAARGAPSGPRPGVPRAAPPPTRAARPLGADAPARMGAPDAAAAAAAAASAGGVQLVITGFGSFHGVASNPTQRLVGWLQEQYGCAAAAHGAAQSAPPPRALRSGHIHSCTVLKVSARAVGEYLTRQLEELKAAGAAACARAAGAPGAAAACAPTVVLLLHFGVDVHVSAPEGGGRVAVAAAGRVLWFLPVWAIAHVCGPSRRQDACPHERPTDTPSSPPPTPSARGSTSRRAPSTTPPSARPTRTAGSPTAARSRPARARRSTPRC